MRDETGPRHPHMHPEAIEGLFEEGIVPKSGLPEESTAAVSTGKQARRQGQRVHQSERRIVGSEGEKLLPEAFLELPEVGRLPREGCQMDLIEGRKLFAIMPLEEEVDTLGGVEPQELAYDLDGENLGVGELWGRAALADAASLESVVDEAED